MRELLNRNHSVTVLAPSFFSGITKVLPELEFISLPSSSEPLPPLPEIFHQLYTAPQTGPHYNEVADVPFIMAQFQPMLYDNDFAAIVELLSTRSFDVAIVDFFAWLRRMSFTTEFQPTKPPNWSGTSPPVSAPSVSKPSWPSHRASLSTTQLHDRSFFTRLKELYLISGAELDFAQALAVTNAKRQTFDLPVLHHGFDVFNGNMVIVAQSFDFEFARALPPNVKMVGRMRTPSRPPNDEDRKLIARLDDLHAKGQHVVYLAFGSLAFLDAPDLLKLIEGVLEVNNAFLVCLLPQHAAEDYLKQFNSALRPDQLQRVEFASWVHQVSVLQHPATKVFITHGGAQSLVEAFEAGLPMLCMPFFGDQPGNCARVRDRGAGLSLFRIDFTIQEVAQKLSVLISNPTFALTSKRIELFRRFTNPAEQFANAVEEAAYFGSQHLLPFSEKLSLVERYSIDIIVGLATLIFSALLLLVALFKRACTSVQRSYY